MLRLLCPPFCAVDSLTKLWPSGHSVHCAFPSSADQCGPACYPGKVFSLELIDISGSSQEHLRPDGSLSLIAVIRLHSALFKSCMIFPFINMKPPDLLIRTYCEGNKSPFTPMRKGTIIYRGTTQLPANKTFTDTFRYVTYTRRQCLLWLKCLRVFASCAPASGFQQCSSRGKFGYLSERKEASQPPTSSL